MGAAIRERDASSGEKVRIPKAFVKEDDLFVVVTLDEVSGYDLRESHAVRLTHRKIMIGSFVTDRAVHNGADVVASGPKRCAS
ncbi:hypothetical protein ASC97_30980 [Rhizobium sp. Root1203]|nr:hypothetical protein ASC97_30980 [Rhizobium sp. Root1203]